MHIGLLVRSKACPRTWDFSGPPNAGHFEEQVRMLWMAHVSEGAQCCTTSTGSDSTASTTCATTTGADGKNANCMRRLYIDIEDVCVYYVYIYMIHVYIYVCVCVKQRWIRYTSLCLYHIHSKHFVIWEQSISVIHCPDYCKCLDGVSEQPHPVKFWC